MTTADGEETIPEVPLEFLSFGPETMEQAAQLLFGIVAVGDDRNVDETWIAGQRAYRKSAVQP